MTTPQEKRRHPMIAFAGGVLAPGLGFWLTGRLPAALLTAALAVAAILVLPLLVVDGTVGSIERLPSILVVASAAIRFGAAAAAAWFAFRDPPRVFQTWEHAWWAAGFVLVTFVASTAIRDRVVSPRVAAFGFVTDTALAPAAEPGAMVVIPKRGFVAADVAINDIVAIRAGSPSWSGELPGFARVIALSGSVVTIDVNGTVTVDGFPIITTPCPPTTPHNGRRCMVEKQATPKGAVERLTTATSFAREFTPTSVGPGQAFVLPDDRGRQLKAPAGLVNLVDLDGTVVIAR